MIYYSKLSRFGRFALLPVLACLFLFGCKKDPATPDTPTTKFIFNLKGTKTINLETTAKDSMAISIERSSGSSEKIELSITGLPQNVTATFEPQSALPPFTSNIIIRSNNAAPGNYPAVLKATGATAGVNEFPFTITVFEEDIACVPGIAGKFSVSEDCEGSPVLPYSATVTADAGDKKGIILKNFANLEIDVKASIVCATKSIVIPEQKIGSNTISGTGTFTDTKLTIDYNHTSTVIGTTYTNSCTARYLRN